MFQAGGATVRVTVVIVVPGRVRPVKVQLVSRLFIRSKPAKYNDMMSRSVNRSVVAKTLSKFCGVYDDSMGCYPYDDSMGCYPHDDFMGLPLCDEIRTLSRHTRPPKRRVTQAAQHRLL